MTTDDRFGRTLSTWLSEEAEHRVPGHLAEVLVQTAATRQRPWWSSLERLLPMTTTTFGGRLAAPRPLLVIATIGLLLAAMVGIAILAGAQQSKPSPFGLAPNGRIYATDGATIRSFAADGTDPQPVFSAAGPRIFGLSVSPDGGRLAFASGADGGNHITVLDLTTGTATSVPSPRDVAAEPIGWSPDGRTLVFAGGDGPASNGSWRVYTAAADGTGALDAPGSRLEATVFAQGHDVWQPQFSPDGEWIAFLSRPAGSGEADFNGEIFLMHPDGEDLHSIVQGVGTPGPLWAPDPAVQRLLFVRSTGPTVLDLAVGTNVMLGSGFWAHWSPDGSRIAYWHDGPVIVDTAAALRGEATEVRPFPSFTGYCQDHRDLTGTTVCSPIGWSPDGTLVYGSDIVDHALLVAPADGSAPARRLPLQQATGLDIQAVWQPIRD